MMLANAAVDEAWQTLRTRVIAHGQRAFIETGAVETIVDVDVNEIGPRGARMSVTLSSGAIICEDFDLWSAAFNQGFDLSAVTCFGSADHPN